ncbi:MAG: FapA family protein [Treponema sp.]|jgi:uncharacterized protein (DUF342 family)|nr:FapA family protein [Treponema sp.]
MTDITAQGDASISINTLETEARLVFTPQDQNGAGWDVNALLRLLEERRLTPLPAPQELQAFLQKASAAKEALDMLICAGTAPEEPVPEQLAWEPLEIPPDIAPLVEEALAKADPPVIVKTKVLKIKRETLVHRPNKLPFLHPKDEVAVVWDQKEIQEFIDVDPEILETRYALAGAKAGVVYPAKPGKPGKNIYGKTLTPAGEGQTEFLLGWGLSRERYEVRAVVSGILRIGAGWADILPLAKPVWEVKTAPDGLTPCLRFIPGDARFAPPAAEDILGAAAASGGDLPLISPQDLAAALQRSIKSGKEIRALPLAVFQEALAEVSVSPDALTASLRLRKALGGGKPLVLKQVSQIIRDAKLQGIDTEALKAAVRAFMDGKDLEFQYTLAEGRPPSRGKDHTIPIRVPLLPPEEARGILDRLTTYARYGQLQARGKLFPLSEDLSLGFVTKDAPVAQIAQGSPGEAGKDVFGNTLPGLPGNDPELHLYQGLYQRGDTIFTGRPGLFMGRAGAGEFWGQVLDYRDSHITVHIAEDAMEASVDLIREAGAGKPLQLEALYQAAAAAGVVKGLDAKAVEAAFHIARAQGSCENYRVARGEAAVAKGGAAVRWLMEIGPHTRTAVRYGAPLAEISPLGEEGMPGFDVKGGSLDPGQADASSVFDPGSVFETPLPDGSGGKRVAAARSGELTFDGKILKIKHCENIQGDVGAETGNINFPGEVWIIGSVHPGYSVIGGEDILISGAAKGALVSAGGKAVVSLGIWGDGKGVVRARTIIEAECADQATLMAVEDIRIKSSCAGSAIKTNGKLILMGEPGSLSGGICKARLGIDAAQLGSEQELPTEISFGQDYLIQNQIEVLEREMEQMQERLVQIDQEIKQVEHIPASLAASRGEKVAALKSLKQLSLKLYTLQVKFREHHASEIRVRGTVYPGVVMESHGRYYEIKQKRNRVIFYFDPEGGRIIEKPLV